MSDEDLFYTPGSIYNQGPSVEARGKLCANFYNDVARRIHGALRELYEASIDGDTTRLAAAQKRAKNTLGWLEY